MKCGTCEGEARWSAGGGAVPEVLACDGCRAEADAENADPVEWGELLSETESAVAAALSLLDSEGAPDASVAFGDVVAAVARALVDPCRQEAFALACGLRDMASEQEHACHPKCDCICHYASVDACEACR